MSYYYVLLNLAILFIFVFAECALHFTSFQESRLRFARFCFLISMVCFFGIPLIEVFFPVKTTVFEIQPLLKQATVEFIQSYPSLQTDVKVLKETPMLPSLINLAIFAGFFICFVSYIKSFIMLKRCVQSALFRRNFKNLSILFSNEKTPFCFSGFRRHYIVIPVALLEKKRDFKIAFRHELQHIRQGDTRWLQLLTFFKLICFWNPFIYLLAKRFEVLQETACDEALILHNKTSAIDYAECLLDVATFSRPLPKGVLGIQSSLLTRRITMLFQYKNAKSKKIALFSAYAACFVAATSTAFAIDHATPKNLSHHEISSIIEQSDSKNIFGITPTPEVVQKLNHFRQHEPSRTAIQASLKRMKQYQPVILAELNDRKMPSDLLAIPLVESGYRPLDASLNRVEAAGIWQIIPSTGKALGLSVKPGADDRLNTQLATRAALDLLQQNYNQFKDWKLAVIAYEIGEKLTEQLISEVGSRDAWVIACSKQAPAGLKSFLALFDASVIVMHNPSIIH